MTFEMHSLRSKVAQRIFGLFILCAVVPIGALSAVAFVHVTRQIDEQSRRRLAQASKTHGMAIFDRLGSAEAVLTVVATALETDRTTREFPIDLTGRFDALLLASDNRPAEVLFGWALTPPVLSEDERRHLDLGQPAVLTSNGPDGPLTLMALELTTEGADRQYVIGALAPAYLWGPEGLLETNQLCVFDSGGRVIGSSTWGCETLLGNADTPLDRWEAARDWDHDGTTYLADPWFLFLKPAFHTNGWTVVLSEELSYLQGPLGSFRRSFGWVTAGSLGLVALLSLIQIRRTLVPLEALREGTKRIAERDLTARVDISTDDEFGELATSFNRMAGHLGRQFKSLSTINEIDRTVLSKLSTAEVIETALTGINSLVPCEDVAIGIIETTNRATVHLRSSGNGGFTTVQTIELRTADLDRLRHAEGGIFDDPQHNPPSYVQPLRRRGIASSLTLPLGNDERLSGFVCFGQSNLTTLEEEDVARIRQVCDQIAVALVNAGLVEQLDRVNWGTLRALARAIDAKSPWTSGHSERVTEMAMKIGGQMGLSATEMNTLRRGGLLHDIGKIGVRSNILDKPSHLTDPELTQMRDHVRIGATILEPLPGFADVLPIVTEHHEWFNGEGYPRGLKGEEISLGARIFAVADVFDALTSPRPYRQGISRSEVMQHIRERAGRQFDPDVVAAFLKVTVAERNGLRVVHDADAHVAS